MVISALASSGSSPSAWCLLVSFLKFRPLAHYFGKACYVGERDKPQAVEEEGAPRRAPAVRVRGPDAAPVPDAVAVHGRRARSNQIGTHYATNYSGATAS